MALSSHTCPHCNTTYMMDNRLTKEHHVQFDMDCIQIAGLAILQHRCPKCKLVHVLIGSTGCFWGHDFQFSYPPSNAMSLPEYIPEALRQDYFEAVQIVDLSPKSAATLARRCLQGMIHDFWGIKEKNLNAEITALRTKIPPKHWEAIDAIRKIGNIGAHMEKDVQLIIDVEPDEAKALLKVIELLFQTWYIRRHEDEALLDGVVAIADEKQKIRLAVRNPNGQ